jgi:DNA-binding SARP family transcriptional activator/class 3 adenylate cyclase/predicted ATPase
MTRIQLQLLGGFSIGAGNGAAVGPLPRKSRALIAYLALAQPPIQPRHRLAGLFWPDFGEAQARASLRQALTAIRKQTGHLLLSDQDAIGFATDAVQVDVTEFEALSASGDQDDHHRAIALYRGDFLDGFQADTSAFDQWLSTERERLHQRAIDLATKLLGQHESEGQIDAAAAMAARIVALDPLREDAHRALMRLHVRQGRPALAMKQYRALRSTLQRELGVPPDPATASLYRRIAQDRQMPAAGTSFDEGEPLPPADDRGFAAAIPGRPTPAEPEASTTDRTAPPATQSSMAERRQLTVLSCEIAGFNDLAARLDPEELWEIVQAYDAVCSACIARFEGTVHHRRGDGTLAFFGVPVAHEDEAARAVHAARAILDEVGRLDIPAAGTLSVRIGIAAGLVVVSSSDKGAIGTAVNVADRLQDIARPGAVVVSDTVLRLAGGAFVYDALGEQALRGIDVPVRAFEVRGATDAPSRFEAATLGQLTPLVGREQELRLLLDRWSLAQDGEGQVVLLSGEPGIGKSRILSVLPERLEARGVQALRFQCSPYHVNSAFWPSIDNFERVLKFAREDNADTKLDKLEALIVGHYGRPRADVRYIASILSIPCTARYGELPMTPQKHKDETLRALVDLTEAAARLQPSVMLFEDLQWADPTTLEILDLVVDRVRSIPLLVVLTHRPEFQSRWGAHGHVASLNLSKLTRAQSRALVTGVAGGKSLPADLLEQILAKTDGVPLFLEELTKSLLESDQLRAIGDRYEYAGTQHDLSIPATLRDSFMARLDRIAAVREVAQIGAVMGREFRHELLAEVVAMTPTALDGALRQLTDAGLAFRRGTPPSAVYIFKHALLQDAAYESLLKSRRQELHGRIARVIEDRFTGMKDTEPELIAHHYTAAGMGAAAVPYWHKAATNAMERVALADALAHGASGLALLPAVPDPRDRARQELGLQLVLGQAAALTKGWAAPEPEQAFSRARALCDSVGDAPEVFPALWGVWAFLDVTGRMVEAQTVAIEFLEQAERMGDRAAACEGHRIVGEMAYRLGDLARARHHLEYGVRLYDAEAHRGNTKLYGQDSCLTNLVYLSWVLWLLGFPDQARRAVERAIVLAEGNGQPFEVAWAHLFHAFLLCNLRDWKACGEAADRVTAVCSEHGYGFWLTFGRCYAGLARMHAEGSVSAGDDVVRQIAVLRSFGAEVSLTAIHALLADGYLALGRVDEGLARIDEGFEIVARTGECFAASELHHVRAELLRKRGPASHSQAEASLARSIEVARAQQARSIELRAATSLARLWQAEGRSEEARALLIPVLDWFTEGFDTRDFGDAKALLEGLA